MKILEVLLDIFPSIEPGPSSYYYVRFKDTDAQCELIKKIFSFPSVRRQVHDNTSYNPKIEFVNGVVQVTNIEEKPDPVSFKEDNTMDIILEESRNEWTLYLNEDLRIFISKEEDLIGILMSYRRDNLIKSILN